MLIGSLALVATDATAHRRQCDDWALTNECLRNPSWMESECKRACECIQWATAGECLANAEFMRVECTAACNQRTSPPPPPPLPKNQCILWAMSGECALNRDFMLASCGDECSLADQRHRCSAHECAGFLSNPCDSDVATRWPLESKQSNPKRNGSWPLAPSLEAAARQKSVGLAVVNDGDLPARLYWVDDSNRETGFGVLMPGARLVQHSWLGHHWRVRELVGERDSPEDGALLLEVHAQLVVAQPCVCTGHLRSRGDYEAASQALGFDGSNETTLLVESRDSAEVVVTHWSPHTDASHDASRSIGLGVARTAGQILTGQDRHANGGEMVVGVLHPQGSRVTNATHQVLVDGVRDGDVVTVRRRTTGQTLMQHVAGDLRASGTQQCRPSRRTLANDLGTASVEATSALKAAAETHAALDSKRSLLMERREVAKADAQSLRAALEQLKQLNPTALASGSLPEELIAGYLSNATDALYRKSRAAEGTPMKRDGADDSSSESGRRRRKSESRQHEEPFTRRQRMRQRAVPTSRSSVTRDELRLRHARA